MSESSNKSSGTGFTGLLLLTFIILKLTKVINWSWWWVLSPAWIGAIIALAMFLVVGIIVWLTSK